MNPDKIASMRKMRAAGLSGPYVAEVLGVSCSVIYAIEQGRAWKNVP